MPFDPYLAARLAPLHGLSWEELAGGVGFERLEEYAADPSPWTMPDVEIADHLAPGPHGEVPIRTYRRRDGASAGGLLWVHGGGFRGGSLDMAESFMVAAELAHRTGVTVASVGYRLAVGGVRFPVPLDDVVAAWNWFVPRVPMDEPVSIGGASAGAALALSAAVRLRDDEAPTPSALLLAYPVVHFPVPALDDEVAVQMRDLPALLRFTPPAIADMFENYVGRLTAIPQLATPGNAQLDWLPPVWLLVCEFDDLRPSAELLARQLAESGVPVRSHLALGMPHGHLSRTPALPEVDRSLEVFADALRCVNTSL